MANWRHLRAEAAGLLSSQKGTPKVTADFSNLNPGLAVTVSLSAHICYFKCM